MVVVEALPASHDLTQSVAAVGCITTIVALFINYACAVLDVPVGFIARNLARLSSVFVISILRTCFLSSSSNHDRS